MQNACQQVPQTCLANQLDDLTRQDLARAAAGTTPLYLVGRYGGGISGSTQARTYLQVHDLDIFLVKADEMLFVLICLFWALLTCLQIQDIIGTQFKSLCTTLCSV